MIMKKTSENSENKSSPFGRDVSKRQSGLKLKVCGMKYQDNINQVVSLRPDYLGFIFYEKSPRYVGQSFSKIELSVVQNGIKKVGVFVNSDIDFVLNTASGLNLDLIQLHGNEPVEYCAEIMTRGLSVIKAIPIAATQDLNKLNKYKNVVDYFLFDTKGDTYGGTGRKFDWRILDTYDLEVPFFLSGGIQLEDIDELAIRSKSLPIHAVDVNSGFEIEPGMKDGNLVKMAIEKLK